VLRGHLPGSDARGIHGDDEAKVYKQLCRVVDEWIRIYQEDGEPLPEATAAKDYSGKFVVRVGKELHKQLAIEAMREGESLNSYCVRMLRRGPGRQRTPNGPRRPAVASRR